MIMKKTSLIISGVAALALALTGCGGGSDTSTTETGGGGSSAASSKTGTGYYVDSAVAGVSYTCGSETGKTDGNGKFTFEQGQDCTFKVAGLTLRKVQADSLVDNAKIVENNVTVARFLQSLDTDGDLSNGIQITDETVAVLTKALQTENIKTVSDATAKLDTVVSHIEQEDSHFNGHVVTEEEAQNHLQATQESVAKYLLAGKTFYVVSSGQNGTIRIFKFIVSSDGTQFQEYDLDTQTQTDDGSITYNGNKVAIGTDGGYIVFTQKDGYIAGQGYQDNGTLEGIKHRLYSSKTDALEYYESLTSGGSTSSQDLNETTDNSSSGMNSSSSSDNSGYSSSSIGGNSSSDNSGNSSSSGSTYYHLKTSDIAGHIIKVGNPSRDKQYNVNGTFTSLESDPNDRDTGTWSITGDGKLKHVWSDGSTEIHYFNAKPANGVTIVNETYGQSGRITEYL